MTPSQYPLEDDVLTHDSALANAEVVDDEEEEIDEVEDDEYEEDDEDIDNGSAGVREPV